ncbi:MAG: hypothetical protein ACK5TK_07615 [Betaproteobacteria bacterium]
MSPFASAVGCALRGAAIGGAGASKLSNTTGNPVLDKGLTHEYKYLVGLFAVQPAFFMLDDEGKASNSCVQS